ncbi:MAG: BON domain-containing protein [Acidobacteria bacterium]|nr:BON domain-containing protein [Acidobacteriota bacterium]
MTTWLRRALLLTLLVAALPSPYATAQSVDDKRRIDDIRIALQRLPYYGVFDFLSFRYERGTVTLAGFAYQSNLKQDAEEAVKRLPYVDTVKNEIEMAPASLNDDRIRRLVYYNIYTDDFLSRYSPGGARRAYIDALEFARFPGIQPLGNHPIHIVVNGGRVTLMGIVDNAADKQIAGVRAREVTGVFGVENDLVVDNQ